MYEKMTLTVGQLNLYIKDIFNQLPGFNDIRVKGEISNFKHHASGHMYMSLKDETGVIKAVMFRNAALGLDFKPENGMQVIAEGRVSVYERDGVYQLYINSMTKDGKGNLHEAFEKLKEKLKNEGLFAQEHKKPIPKYPTCVGVITASTGAAVRDIINILSRRYRCADVVLYPVLVQGEGAAENIAEAIKYFNEKRTADVLIVGRGGGSIEDLWAFNEEIVARAIYESEIPVISAVGHETDFTIADFVADLRAPTPSAAAELAVPSGDDLAERLMSARNRLKIGTKKCLENKRYWLDFYTNKQVMKNPVLKIDEKGMQLDHIYKMFEKAVEKSLNEKKQALQIEISKLNGLSPLNTLSRGFSLVKSEDGVLVKSVNDVQANDSIFVKVKDGEISAVVRG